MKRFIVLGVLLASVGFFAASATAETLPTTNLDTHYTNLLDTKLDHCKAKTRYQASRLEAMRTVGTRAAQKAHYLETHRDTLLTEMRAADLGTNTVKGEHFLNTRFAAHRQALRTHYTAYLDTKITNCKAKLRYGQSKFDTLQRKAAESALRAQFLQTHQDELVTQMLNGLLGTQTAKLDHFVNQQFSDYVHPQLLAYLTGR